MDDWVPALAALAGTVTGGLLTWHVDVRKWKREERYRRDKQSEDAAGELLVLIDEALYLFKLSTRMDDGPEQEVVHPVYRAIRRHAVDIRNAPVRTRIEQVATCFYNYAGAQDYGYYPRQTAYIAAEAGRALLGALRRSEDPPEVPKLEELHNLITEHYELLAESQEELRRQSGCQPG